jgi:hypothetical protein
MPSPSGCQSLLYLHPADQTFDPIATYSYTMLQADTRNKFLTVFEGIREELIAHMKSEKMPEDAIVWFNEVTSYIHSTEYRCSRPRRDCHRCCHILDLITGYTACGNLSFSTPILLEPYIQCPWRQTQSRRIRR